VHIVVLAGPPCAGKTTLAHRLAQSDDVVLDYDDIARDMGSPAWHIHPEPWRSRAEAAMQALIAQAHVYPSDGTAWTLRTTPRPEQRMAMVRQWQAQVYVLNPGQAECRRRAQANGRPTGTAKRIGTWYWQYRPSSIDLDASMLDPSSPRRVVMVDPRSV
jgi:predicted kinase